MNTEESTYLLQPFDHSRRRSAAISRSELRLVAGALFLKYLGLAEALAHPGIQRQVDPESGITTYSFRPATGFAGTKHEPPPAPQPAPAITAPPTTTAAPKEAENKIARSIAVIPPSLRDFPRVPAEIQKERDAERKRILKQELAWEEEKLNQALASKASDDNVTRYRTNIEALNREIRNVQ